MEWLRLGIDIFLHLDKHLNTWAGALGPWLYLLLFVIILCETGLVVMPYLPGDSLLFAVGALAARPGSPIDLALMCLLLSGAAIIGDTINYAVGKWLGPKVFHYDNSRWLDRRHLDRAHKFYEKYGGKTIVLARFLPIIRTFAPFVAGIGTRSYSKFLFYNVVGGVAWTCSFLLLGYRFAELPVVKSNFHFVILAIIVISVIPVIMEYLKARKEMSADAA